MKIEDIDFVCRKEKANTAINKLLCLESTHTECSGRVLKMDYIEKASKLARKHKMKMHLDGARCLNAAVSLGISPAEMTKRFHTVSVCLSKGLGCPVGSMVIGSRKDIKHALVLRKLLGGNLRQAGILAKAGLENLEDWEETLAEDHRKAQWFANELSKIPCIELDQSVIETNIFRFKFKPDFNKFQPDEFAVTMRDNHGILLNIGHNNEALRIVTHRDLSNSKLKSAIASFKKELK